MALLKLPIEFIKLFRNQSLVQFRECNYFCVLWDNKNDFTSLPLLLSIVRKLDLLIQNIFYFYCILYIFLVSMAFNSKVERENHYSSWMKEMAYLFQTKWTKFLQENKRNICVSKNITFWSNLENWCAFGILSTTVIALLKIFEEAWKFSDKSKKSWISDQRLFAINVKICWYKCKKGS